MLGIVVVSFGSADLLRENLARVDRAAMRTASAVVVVDSYRDDASRAAVERCTREHGWDLVAPDVNTGFGGGMNLGVARAIELGCTSVVLLNPDLAATADVLDALAEEAERSPRTLISPRIVRPDGRAWFTGGALDLRTGWTRNVEAPATPQTEGWLTGASLACSVELWREVGGFDDHYFLYWEDVDLSYRCTAAGGTLLVRQDLTCVHDVGGTQGMGKSPTYYYYNCRNRMVFAAKHLDRPAVRSWLVRTPAYARAVLLRGGRRQLLRPWRPVSAVVRGSTSGALQALRAPRRRPR